MQGYLASGMFNELGLQSSAAWPQQKAQLNNARMNVLCIVSPCRIPRSYHFTATTIFNSGVPPYPAVPVAVSPLFPGLILPKSRALAALCTFRLVLGPPQLYHLKGFWMSRR